MNTVASRFNPPALRLFGSCLGFPDPAHPRPVCPEMAVYYEMIGAALLKLEKVDGGINSIVTIVLKQFRQFLDIEKSQPLESKFLSSLQEEIIFPDSPLLIKNIDRFLDHLDATRNLALMLNYLSLFLELQSLGHIPIALNGIMQRGIHKEFELIAKWDDGYIVKSLHDRRGVVEISGGYLVDTSAFSSKREIAHMLIYEAGHRGVIHNGHVYRLWALELLTWMRLNENAINAILKVYNWKSIQNEFEYGVEKCLASL